MDFELRYHKKRFDKYSYFVLGGDIGGTNTNLCVAGVKENKPVMLFSTHFKSQEMDSLVPAVRKTMEFAKSQHGIAIARACFAVAAPVPADQVVPKLTNADWGVSAKNILRKTRLRSVLLINDLEAVGYGLNMLGHSRGKDIMTIRRPVHKGWKATKVVLAPGTGLGKSILVYDKSFDAYIPVASEGGHSDFPVYDTEELAFIDFVKKLRKISHPLVNEELVSGRGIEAIYKFIRRSGRFKPTVYSQEIDKSGEQAALISKYRKRDHACSEAFRLFTKFCARAAKNLVMETVAVGGLYFGGGIAAKNYDIFKTREFINEFEDVDRMSHIPKQTPIYVIMNYDISLYGASFAAIKRQDLAIKS